MGKQLNYNLVSILNGLDLGEKLDSENSQNYKKLLILSLGVGILKNQENKTVENKHSSADNAYEELERGKYHYQTAEYYVKEEDKSYRAPFVGEPLISVYKPDDVVVIGTVKSMWHALYYRLTDGKKEEKRKKTFSEIYDLCENNKGFETTSEELVSIQEELNKWFSGIDYKKAEKKVKFHVILMEYGPDAGEEKEKRNYGRIRDVSQIVKSMKAQCVHVAFDITHSFRSIPIYNLAALNYIKSLGKYNIVIDHVYYGNLDISREYYGKSPVERIKYLILMMELAGSVEMFQLTGNVRSIIDECKKMGDDTAFIKLLESYELAIQCNDYQKIAESIRSLIHFECKTEHPILADVQGMISNVLKNRFETVLGMSGTDLEKKTIMQSELAQWYYEQHRYGLALATGIEAYRSVFVQLFTDGKSESEPDRRNSIEELGRIVKSGRASELLINVENSIKQAKDVRNRFAHCLAGGTEEEMDYETNRTIIDNFFRCFQEFFLIRKENGEARKQYEEEYRKKEIANKGIDPKEKKLKKRFIVSTRRLSEERLKKYRKSSNNRYIVEQLDAYDFSCIEAEKSIQEKVRCSCELVGKKLEKAEAETTVIVDVKSLSQTVQHIVGLRKVGVRQKILVYSEDMGNVLITNEYMDF